ncbi:ArsR/SmtB family transcription factor [Chitinolyticbacter albus]|uniref:ArsR/SmtB family transcription factor n=1 Tax=Chitinolyticbacter albus TaxID=2961951 RepID=UPI002109E81B|nr:metalloregulator ArsR/SmtB family transcription factor [Chitinolyticbacter albus]
MENKAAVTRLAALAQDTRLSIFRLLITAGPEGMAVGRIGETLGVAPATLSFHLKEMAHAQLVLARQESRFIFYSANYAAMNELLGFLTENCCAGTPCEAEDELASCAGKCN